MTQEKLKKYLRYNPCTGVFTWRIGRCWGQRAGSVNREGYNSLRIEGKTYRLSRLAWLYVYGEQPNIIDHIDRDRGCDSIWNLTNGTLVDNARNTERYIGWRRASLYRSGSRLRSKSSVRS